MILGYTRSIEQIVLLFGIGSLLWGSYNLYSEVKAIITGESNSRPEYIAVDEVSPNKKALGRITNRVLYWIIVDIRNNYSYLVQRSVQ